MRSRTKRWLLLFGLSACSTSFLACAATIPLELLNSAVSGLYRGAEAWGFDASMEFLANLNAEDE